jgi:predicted ATPase
MQDGYQLKYRTTHLDPDMLSSPFEIQTKWHVITGAPCSGKTTLIDMLAEEGYKTVAEGARACFEAKFAKGLTFKEIMKDAIPLHHKIFDVQLELERNLRPGEVTFLDRALPDSLSSHRVFGMDPNSILADCFRYRYASVFILEQLPQLRERTLGPEDAETADFLDEWLVRDYSTLGYEVVRVPVLAPQERFQFVLDFAKQLITKSPHISLSGI